MGLAHNIEDTERTEDVRVSENVTFSSMLLEAETLEGLKNSGFYKPSPIQLYGIPLGKCGFDLLLEAKSGTGKTAVFTITALEKLNLKKGLQTVILAPTREIAAQIYDVIKQIGSCYEGLRVAVVMGGLSVQEDIEKFENSKVHIVVGSPGRLRHLIQDKHIDTSAVRVLVLDEADKLMEKTFLRDINYIFSILPKEKQVIMSSATYPESTKSFIQQYVQNAQHVCPETNSVLLGIQQKVTIVKHKSNIVQQTKYRFEELLKILARHPFKQCLIFCNYQARVAELHKLLTREKWPATQLYGQQEQLDRLGALKSLQEYKCRILISTDLAARGIDASNVDLVINFEPPFEWQTYLHRIGRAGRFGSYGMAVTILSDQKEKNKFTEIVEAIKAPLNLSLLWDGEPFIIDNTVEISSVSQESKSPVIENESNNIKTSETLESLWNELTSKINGKSNNMESFKLLCESYEVPNIESFTDLLNSLEHHHDDGIKSSYRHLEIPNPINKNYFNNTSVTVKPQTENVKDRHLDSVKTHSNVFEVNNKTHKDISQSKGVIAAEKYNIVEELNSTSNLIYSTEENMTKQKKPKGTCDAYDMSNMEEALLKAGLPTAFGSFKDKPRTNYSRRTNNKNTRYEFNSDKNSQAAKQISASSYSEEESDNLSENERSYIAAKYTKVCNKYPNKFMENNNSLVDDEKDNGYNYMSYNQYSNRIKTQSKHAGYWSQNNTFLNSGNRAKTEKHSAVNSDYNKWYNNLKITVKQIEYAIYIDEMSKLYKN